MGPLRQVFRFASIRFLIFASLSIAVSISGPVFADESSTLDSPPPDSARYHLPPVVVTAEREPVPLDHVPAEITVVGRDRLDRNQAPFAADELRLVPALDVRRSGTPGKLTDVRLRGADPRHTLILFDGIPLNGPWTGTFDFADVPAAGLGQIEVMGGPASSLYGSGAVGGVIHLLSPAGVNATGRARLRAAAEYGERSTLRQSLEGNWTDGRHEANGYASRLASDGEIARDGYEGLAGRVHGSTPLAGGRLRLSALATRGTKEVPYDFRFDMNDFLTHQVLDPNTEETDRVIAGGVAWSRPLHRGIAVEAEASGFSGSVDYENRADTTGGDFVDTHLDNARGIAALRLRAGNERRRVLLGAEYRDENVERDDDSRYGGFPSISTVDRGTHTRSLYAQAHAQSRRLIADAGLRLDDHSRYGAFGVPRIAVALPLPEAGLRLRGGYGRAFLAPTLTDLYYPFYGSETLRPERSRTWEGGADGRWLRGALSASVTWHTTRFRDLIQSNSYFVADNIGRARIEGSEASLRIAPSPRAAFGATTARLIGKNLDGGARLAKRPAWRGSVFADVAPVSWGTLSAALYWSDSMVDPFAFVDTDGRFRSGDTPAYTALDLGAAASLGRWIPAEARVRVGNALDRRYEEVKGFPAPGRWVTVGLAYAR